MKRILITLFAGLFLLALPNYVQATHVAGGDISYEYIGDSTGIPFQYCITLIVYEDDSPGTAGIGTFPQTLDINSTCFGSSSVSLAKVIYPGSSDGARPPKDYQACVDPNDPGGFPIMEHVFKGCVTLQGKCADWTFSWDLCCRNGMISNLDRKSVV